MTATTTIHKPAESMVIRTRRSLMRGLVHYRETIAVLVALVLTLVFAVTTNGVFLNHANMVSVTHVTAVLAIIAIGQSLVICAGEIDISVGSIFAMGAMTFLAVAPEFGVFTAVGAALLVGFMIGAFNGYLVAYLGIPSLIITLSSLFIFRGIAYMLVQDGALRIPLAERMAMDGYLAFGSGTFFGFNNSVLWMLAFMVVLHLVMFTMPFGNRLLAVGGDAKSATSRGVRVRHVKLTAFIVVGLCAAFAGILEANKVGYADGTTGRLMELEAIAACVVGGCALAGGRMSIIGTIAGAFILASIQSYLVITGTTPQLYLVVMAAFVICAALLDARVRQWALRLR